MRSASPTAITRWSRADWRWYQKIYPDLQAEIVTTGGKNALRLPGAFNQEKPYIKNACARSTPFALAPGKHYRLTFQLRHEDATGELVARFVCENQGLWKAFGSQGFALRPGLPMAKGGQRKPRFGGERAGTSPAATSGSTRCADMSDVTTATEAIPCQTAFALPKPGDADCDARVTELTLQFQLNSSQGWAEISDLHLDEVEAATEWEAWQMAGADTHSVVADPLFVDLEHGDFTLQPESPVLKLEGPGQGLLNRCLARAKLL